MKSVSENQKSKIVNNKSKNVWRIFHFAQRFEMDAYRRQGGLDYLRMFITATTADKSNESSDFLAQLEELEHYYPEQRDAYEGRFWRLGRLTATQEDWLRGYLLDAEQRPLTVSKLGARLHLSVAVMRQTLAALKKVGLVEYVLCPEFTKPERGKNEGAKKGGSKDKGKGKGASKSGTGGPETAKKRSVRKRFKTFRNVPEYIQESELELESESESESNKIGIGNRTLKEKEILGLKSSDKETEPKTKQSRQGQTGHDGKGQLQEKPPTSPATAPPISPTVSDEGGTKQTVSDEGDPVTVIPLAGSPGSVKSGPPGHVADGVRRVKARLNPQAQAAALEVYRELGGRWPPDTSRKTAQDLGSYRNAYVRVFESGLSPPVAEELWESMLREAKRLKKAYSANGGYRRAKCVWFKPILKDKLDARLRECKAM